MPKNIKISGRREKVTHNTHIVAVCEALCSHLRNHSKRKAKQRVSNEKNEFYGNGAFICDHASVNIARPIHGRARPLSLSHLSCSLSLVLGLLLLLYHRRCICTTACIRDDSDDDACTCVILSRFYFFLFVQAHSHMRPTCAHLLFYQFTKNSYVYRAYG